MTDLDEGAAVETDAFSPSPLSTLWKGTSVGVFRFVFRDVEMLTTPVTLRLTYPQLLASANGQRIKPETRASGHYPLARFHTSTCTTHGRACLRKK